MCRIVPAVLYYYYIILSICDVGRAISTYWFFVFDSQSLSLSWLDSGWPCEAFCIESSFFKDQYGISSLKLRHIIDHMVLIAVSQIRRLSHYCVKRFSNHSQLIVKTLENHFFRKNTLYGPYAMYFE